MYSPGWWPTPESKLVTPPPVCLPSRPHRMSAFPLFTLRVMGPQYHGFPCPVIRSPPTSVPAELAVWDILPLCSRRSDCTQLPGGGSVAQATPQRCECFVFQADWRCFAAAFPHEEARGIRTGSSKGLRNDVPGEGGGEPDRSTHHLSRPEGRGGTDNCSDIYDL